MNLTDKDFWIRYWKSRTDILKKVSPKDIQNEVFDSVLASAPIKTAVELGGFPGYHSIYLAKYHNVKCTILDYVIIKGITDELIRLNGLEPNAVDVVEGDIFSVSHVEKYDLAFSNGLLEHFEDTELVLRRHTKFVKKGGSIIVTVPNFKGLNGWLQKIFDFENYISHNLNCMDKDNLLKICHRIGLVQVQVNYYGKFDVWLENKPETAKIGKLLTRLLYWIGKRVFTVINYEGRTFSPFIIVTARLPEFEDPTRKHI